MPAIRQVGGTALMASVINKIEKADQLFMESAILISPR